ncbi:hypothetical protein CHINAEXTREME_19495 [Halobiforma lacisalsi AJ5]|uniref:Uncharacterized protein n=2 Tax=Natronobacterium lacisalsi TaxID=229731 RepID=M0LSB6_NATLA|nr:hypothetical protein CHINAEXTREME_19495 [Halobiforma lacisalsi AJ5]EMA35998.1 hypothetical protein C445_04053 [Halobiforma lacisalsi AJ5]
MGVPFEMETDEANVFVDARLEYDLDVPGSIPTSESEQAGIEKPASDDDSSTSVDPDAVQYIPIALGGANFLVSVGDMMDNTSTHAGVQIAWFLQNLTQGTTITSDFGSDTTFDVVEVIQEGSGEHSNTLEQTDSEEGIFRSGDVYRIGAAIGGSVEVSLYRSRTDLEFEAKIKSMEIRA